jgi:[ribosomal protein S18]-alanine N-acetyltransferase
MTMELRLLARVELGAAAKLHAVCFPTDAWTPRDFMDLLAIRGASGHLVLTPQGAIGGFIVDIVSDDDAEILTIGVAPELRRRGFARTMIADLEKRARRRGARRLLLEVAADNAAALQLYHSLGFALLGERPGYYRRPGGKTDAYILACPLPSLPELPKQQS